MFQHLMILNVTHIKGYIEQLSRLIVSMGTILAVRAIIATSVRSAIFWMFKNIFFLPCVLSKLLCEPYRQKEFD